jgi:hypothetical protein
LRPLAAWLDHQRHTPRIAEALHVHPQTVRYRIAKLRELLGDTIDDPDVASSSSWRCGSAPGQPDEQLVDDGAHLSASLR